MTQTNLAVFGQNTAGFTVEQFARASEEVSRKLEREHENRRLKEEFSVEYCFDVIAKEDYLWDMRCWDKLHDREEVLAWIKGDTRTDSKNCGHCALCIHVLKLHDVPLEKIADAILSNNKVQFRNRIVKCFEQPRKCPNYAKQGHYGNGICGGCENNERR